MGSLEYTNDAPSGVPSIQPLSMIFDRSSHELILLSRGSDKKLTTFSIDVVKQHMEER